MICLLSLLAGCAHTSDASHDGLAVLQGSWLPVSAELSGRPFPEEVRKTISLAISGDSYLVMVGKGVDRGSLHADPSTTPRSLDITGVEGPNKGKTFHAIYDREGDTVRICYDLSGAGRPVAFETKPGTQLFLVTYKLQ